MTNSTTGNFSRRFSLTRGILMFITVLSLGSAGLNAQVLVPFSGSNTLSCGTNTVLRDHANFTTYANNANGYTVIQPGFNAVIMINGNYITESSFDYVRIYNGVGTGGTMLINVSGTGVINFTSTPGQTITVQFISDGSVVYQGFDLQVTFSGPCNATPCSGAPGTLAVTPSAYTTCIGLNDPGFGLVGSYTVNGITYQWQSSTVSPVGPWTSIPNATNASMPAFTSTATTYYQVVATCTNGNFSTPIPAGPVTLGGTVVSTVPYLEDFEGIAFNNRLPNCSWAISNPTLDLTYTAPATLNRIPNSGSKFASFYFGGGSNTSYFYTNQIFLNQNVTYSVGLWYTSDLTGAINWPNLSIWTGTTQSASSMTQIASTTGAAVSPSYKLLSNTFTVPATGLYYVGIKATSSSGTAQYLSWDDLSITIPCSVPGNSAQVSITPNTATVCQNASVTLNASGGSNYVWSNGSSAASQAVAPALTSGYSVIGTNTLTGCTGSASALVTVKPLPPTLAQAFPPRVCKGKAVTLVASGAGTYMWNNNSTSAVNVVTPNSSTSYTVIGTATNNCSRSYAVNVLVDDLPVVTSTVSRSSICVGESIQLSAGGATTYTWQSSSGQYFTFSPVTVSPGSTVTYSVSGSDDNGCTGVSIQNVSVEPCVGLATQVAGSFRFYPNPVHDRLSVDAEGVITSLSIVDLSGRTLLHANPHGSSAAADLSGLAPGVYFVRVSTADASTMIKVVKD